MTIIIDLPVPDLIKVAVRLTAENEPEFGATFMLDRARLRAAAQVAAALGLKEATFDIEPIEVRSLATFEGKRPQGAFLLEDEPEAWDSYEDWADDGNPLFGAIGMACVYVTPAGNLLVEVWSETRDAKFWANCGDAKVDDLFFGVTKDASGAPLPKEAAPAPAEPAEAFPYAPEACPSKHWNRGDGICEDCGVDLT